MIGSVVAARSISTTSLVHSRAYLIALFLSGRSIVDGPVHSAPIPFVCLLLTLSLTVTVRTTSCFHGCCFSLLLRLVKANPISPPAISFTPDFG